MEDTEGVLSFDFEGGLDSGPVHPTASMPAIPSDNSASASAASVTPPTDLASNYQSGRRSFRQTVCRHWLRSLCMKGDACGFLHQYDKARMPVCRFFRLYGECREQDCVYKHTNEDIKECNMYKLGFCPNGPDCRYRHAKLPGPPPSVEEILQKIQQLTSYYGQNKFFQQRGGYNQQADRPQFPQGPNHINHQPHEQQQQQQQQPQQQQQQLLPQQQVSQTQLQTAPNGVSNQPNRTATPLPPGISRYFIVKSCNRENLELSVQQGVWATQRSNEAKLNEAFDSAENVILIFSVNRTRHFQGCAKMSSKIGATVGGGNWKYQHGTAHYGRNFSVKWLKLCELSFHKTRHLRNPYNENLPVKISRDCQELEPSIGEQLASLLYLEPDSELMAISIAAEAKREEEKAKGVNTENENPDIVLFDDNEEEEEEEESEDEEESFGQPAGAPVQGRGRGRGLMWPPQMPPMGRGIRPMPGLRGFPPMMMGGGDGFSFGHVTPDGFGMPDPFGMAPRGFNPYGPRFSGEFAGPGGGMMFPGRPPQPGGMFPPGGFGMNMGPSRGPFMGGMGPNAGNAMRGGRPGMLLPPLQAPQPQNNMRSVKRDPRQEDGGSYQHQGQKGSNEEQFGGGNSFKNDESESEDEAPRRSRHGEGKKKRRGSEGEGAQVSDQ
ncbi:30-kDa cleavage and polyadenylation specificity factor 30 [Linum perenne]